jgi:hypothetical protein
MGIIVAVVVGPVTVTVIRPVIAAVITAAIIAVVVNHAAAQARENDRDERKGKNDLSKSEPFHTSSSRRRSGINPATPMPKN